MTNKIHVGIDVIDLNQSISFYKNCIEMNLISRNNKHRNAVFSKYNTEINLFEKDNFKGYNKDFLNRFHIGIQVSHKKDVNRLYQKCLDYKASIVKSPYTRFDGDYTFFIQDPNHMNIEIFYGDHSNIKNDLEQL